MSTVTRPKHLDSLSETWRAFEKQWAPLHRNKPAGYPPFFDYAWKPFDPTAVLSILARPDESYEGHQALLFAGICTWVVCPENDDLIRNAIKLEGIDQICWAEALGRGAFPDDKLLGEIIGPITKVAPDFYRDFLHPIGGMRVNTHPLHAVLWAVTHP